MDEWVAELQDQRFPKTRRGTALVLGAGGKLGQALARTVLKRYHFRVIGLTRQDCDITRRDQLAAALGAYRPQVVYNAAAFNAVDDAEASPGLAFRVNATAPALLAGLCATSQTRLVHFSTDYVFPGRPGPPYRESDEPAPLSQYGRSKLEGERAALAGNARDSLVIRVCSLYDDRGPCFPRTILRRVLRDGQVRVVADRCGSLIWAEHLAYVVAEAVALGVSGLLHIVPPDVAPWDELARGVLQAAGVAGEVIPISTAEQQAAARRPACSQLAIARLGDLKLPQLPAWRAGLELFFRERGHDLLARLRRDLPGDRLTGRPAPGPGSTRRGEPGSEPTSTPAHEPAPPGPPHPVPSPAPPRSTSEEPPRELIAIPGSKVPEVGVILAGGTGSRLRELARGGNKHLLTVGGRPMLAHGIAALAAAGVRRLFVVASQEHFLAVDAAVQAATPPGTTSQTLLQARPVGSADALFQVYPFARGEPLAVLLGDNLFAAPLAPLLARTPAEEGQALVVLASRDDLTGLGVAQVDAAGQVTGLWEKPDPARLPPLPPGHARLAATGLYRLPADALEQIGRLTPAPDGELVLLDLLRGYHAAGRLQARRVTGWWVDAGTPEGLRLARERLGGPADADHDP
ncbi:MAG: dTDP-4-dehydrorhamnose reductase [Myxococcota bacterium]|jgi:dTDP-4-dehydrorhamnose reductase|nr:dTDP-4-dehydrorhamnose reductase [Myxococcota bacterium]